MKFQPGDKVTFNGVGEGIPLPEDCRLKEGEVCTVKCLIGDRTDSLLGDYQVFWLEEHDHGSYSGWASAVFSLHTPYQEPMVLDLIKDYLESTT